MFSVQKEVFSVQEVVCGVTAAIAVLLATIVVIACNCGWKPTVPETYRNVSHDSGGRMKPWVKAQWHSLAVQTRKET